MNKTWLEPFLAQHLGRVKAPDELWDRIQAPPPPPARRFATGKLVWAVAAALLVAAVVWKVYPRPDRTAQNEKLAAQALTRELEQIEYRSEDSAQIRGWIKEHTGLDVPMPPKTASSIRLVGAHLISGREAAAEVHYRVGDREAVLMVAKADPHTAGNGLHRFLNSGQRQGARVSSWTMRGQMYTVARPFPQDPHVGCLLCHAGGAPDVVVN